MKFNKDGRRSYRNSGNCLDTELTPVHIFDCPAILAALQEREIGVFFSSTNIYVDSIEQMPGQSFDTSWMRHHHHHHEDFVFFVKVMLLKTLYLKSL
ncbi:hypothetical protein TNCV_4412331 [Trichonephila clavipes]|nr:hypothetical protein TNCV_4412331 [Trichonephila clavipes]